MGGLLGGKPSPPRIALGGCQRGDSRHNEEPLRTGWLNPHFHPGSSSEGQGHAARMSLAGLRRRGPEPQSRWELGEGEGLAKADPPPLMSGSFAFLYKNAGSWGPQR